MFMYQHSGCALPIDAEWRIYASVNYILIGLGNGLSPVRRHAIMWTNADLCLLEL